MFVLIAQLNSSHTFPDFPLSFTMSWVHCQGVLQAFLPMASTWGLPMSWSGGSHLPCSAAAPWPPPSAHLGHGRVRPACQSKLGLLVYQPWSIQQQWISSGPGKPAELLHHLFGFNRIFTKASIPILVRTSHSQIYSLTWICFLKSRLFRALCTFKVNPLILNNNY